MAAKNKIVKVSDFPLNHQNPFLPEAIPAMKKHFVRAYVNSVGNGAKAIINGVDPDTGEIVAQPTFMRKKIVDDEEFTKLYLSQFQAFFELSTVGLRVFGYLMQCMKPSIDMIYFDKEACKEFTHYSASSSIYRGIAELLNCGVIARGWADNIFFINPLISWNGSRVTFVTQYEKKSKSKQIEDKNQLSMDFDALEAEFDEIK